MFFLCQCWEDILLLVDYFLWCFVECNCKVVKGFMLQVMDLLIYYDWLGNICELENVIEWVVVLLMGEYIFECELFFVIVVMLIKIECSGEIQLLVEVEKEVILVVLEKMGGNKMEVVCQLGIMCKMLLVKILCQCCLCLMVCQLMLLWLKLLFQWMLVIKV